VAIALTAARAQMSGRQSLPAEQAAPAVPPATIGPVTTGVIEWQTGPSYAQVRTPVEAAAAAGEILAAGERHQILHFAQAVTPQVRARLAAAGIDLLDYLGDNAFFAAASTAADWAALGSERTLMDAQPIQRRFKLQPDLLAGAVYPFAVVAGPKDKAVEELTPEDNPTVAVYVQFHRDVDLTAEAEPAVLEHRGWVRSVLTSINMIVVELPYLEIAPLADEDVVQWIEFPLPKFSELNNSNRSRTQVETVWSPPYGLDGSGVTVLVYDGGTADQNHPDFGGRVTELDTSGVHYHSTHVAGTIGGSGASSGGTYAGMAPNCTMVSYGFEMEGGLQEGFLYTEPGDIEADYSEAISVYGATISNNSIGTNTAPNGFPCDWEGNYSVTSALIDTIVRGDGTNPLFAEPFRIVWANGNERQVSRCLGVEGYPSPYHSTAPPACAKNHITVGAMNSNDDSVTDFTSFGPADDGRMKPDISAPGCQSNDDQGVTSCNSGGGYTTLCGTSMASPTACGIGALLIQDYRQLFPGEPDFRNSSLKVLFAHSAVDLANPGPDYQTGYGSIRAPAAVDLLRSGNWFEASINHGDTYRLIALVGPEDTELKVTIAWDDYPGTENTIPELVNDLDLKVIGPDDTEYWPWTLDKLNPAANAVRTQANHVDNLEQVWIPNPAPGAYQVEVIGFNVPEGPQPFSLAGSPEIVNCSSQGIIVLNKGKYPCGATATLQVIDCDVNTDDQVAEVVDVTITSDSEPAGELVTLTETAPASSKFEGTILMDITDAAGVLLIADGDTVTATYIDADDGLGNFNVPVVDTALIDCTPPVISNVQVTDIGPRSATITFDTDEPALASALYGLDCGSLTDFVDKAGFRTAHSVMLTGLTDNTTYYFSVGATDEAGNAAADDNGGSCYSFTTPEIPDFFTELFTGDFDLDGFKLLLEPNASVDFYGACVEEITGLPTDPAGGTVLSFSNMDDGSTLVSLTGGAQVWLYGVSYSSFYVGTNGYITFGTGDTEYSESLEEHFSLPRVAAYFDDLHPGNGGSVSWKQLADRVAVTWQNVPEYSATGSNTFQIELFFDGQIHISWYGLTGTDCVSGISEGTGLSPDFYETDLSASGSCGPKPPQAFNVNTSTPAATPIVLTLPCTDDGLPTPPGALSVVIVSLPSDGQLSDPQAGLIASVPYTLANFGQDVEYQPSTFLNGLDSFQFQADDGGTPPEGGLSNVATVTVDVGTVGLVFNFPMDTDPGWSTQGLWQYGTPLGTGSHNNDPSAGHTGTNVYGYNLAGDYTNNMSPLYLTTTAFDFTDTTEVELRFWRWIGVERSPFDNATVEVSSNGTTWTTLWSNPTTSLAETSWSQQVFDISALADNQPTFYVRWGMGPTDNGTTYPGWNIDDVEIWGRAPGSGVLPGDMNCDGLVNNADIPVFVLALTDPDQYALLYPDCDADQVGDFDGNGVLNNADIPGFVAALTGG